MSLRTTSSQTVGPYLHIGLTWLITENLAVPGVEGAPITIDVYGARSIVQPGQLVEIRLDPPDP